MMTTRVRETQAALAKARRRRLVVDAERDGRDRRVEEAAAEVFVLLADREELASKLVEINVRIGTAVRRIAGEGLTLPALAELLELDLAEVRQLSRTMPS